MDVKQDVREMLGRALVVLTTYPQSCTADFSQRGVVAVFGRYSPDLARMLGYVCRTTNPRYLMVSGKKGKDSGILPRWGVAEAHYLISAADALYPGALSIVEVGVDLEAKNGLENAMQLAKLLLEFGFKGYTNMQLVVTAHSLQMFRLGATFTRVLIDANLRFASVRWSPSLYKPNLARLQDQWEICFELIKLAEMREKGWVDLSIPRDLLDWAHTHLEEVKSELEAQKSPLSTAGLRSY